MELENLLTRLKLEHLEHQLDAVCEQAAQRQADYKTFLAQALQAEWQGRFQRGIEARLKLARFPWLKTSTSSTSTSSPAWTASRYANWPG